MDLAAQFEQALRQLAWIDEQELPSTRVLVSPASDEDPDRETCWLRWCYALGISAQGAEHSYLNATGRASVQQLIEAGWSLRGRWRRAGQGAREQWLGERFYFGHAGLFADNMRLVSLVGSRMGRHGSGHPEWPRWIDAALRHVRQHHERLLIAADTTLAEIVEHFARVADVPMTAVRWTKHDRVCDWLCDKLPAARKATIVDPQPRAKRSIALRSNTSATGERQPQVASLDQLDISPARTPACELLCDAPLQDRLSIALADSVLALWLRAGGTLERLVAERLLDRRFPTGSVFVTLPSGRHANRTGQGSEPKLSAEHHADWLERGAVGWIVPQSNWPMRSPLRHCTRDELGSCQPAVQQLSAPLPSAWRELPHDAEWPYLVHCTRGTLGPLPEESLASFRERVWMHGESVALQPLETLARICQEGLLRATGNITRAVQGCVSFSAVPLVPLLQRRTFRSHLGRWDWEPYGVLIRRDALMAIGAAEVIYGSEQDFRQLPVEKQPMFQPLMRSTGKQPAPWSDEREWRALRDVSLHTLPHASIIIFVRTQSEARQLSRYISWPVLWTSS